MIKCNTLNVRCFPLTVWVSVGRIHLFANVLFNFSLNFLKESIRLSAVCDLEGRSRLPGQLMGPPVLWSEIYSADIASPCHRHCTSVAQSAFADQNYQTKGQVVLSVHLTVKLLTNSTENHSIFTHTLLSYFISECTLCYSTLRPNLFNLGIVTRHDRKNHITHMILQAILG